jgi:hypothetical protein
MKVAISGRARSNPAVSDFAPVLPSAHSIELASSRGMNINACAGLQNPAALLPGTLTVGACSYSCGSCSNIHLPISAYAKLGSAGGGERSVIPPRQLLHALSSAASVELRSADPSTHTGTQHIISSLMELTGKSAVNAHFHRFFGALLLALYIYLLVHHASLLPGLDIAPSQVPLRASKIGVGWGCRCLQSVASYSRLN